MNKRPFIILEPDWQEFLIVNKELTCQRLHKWFTEVVEPAIAESHALKKPLVGKLTITHIDDDTGERRIISPQAKA